jgi:hypothetical protein
MLFDSAQSFLQFQVELEGFSTLFQIGLFQSFYNNVQFWTENLFANSLKNHSILIENSRLKLRNFPKLTVSHSISDEPLSPIII